MSAQNYIEVTGPSVCFAHGPYHGEQCSQMPACSTDPQKPEYLKMAYEDYSHADAKWDAIAECGEVVSGLAGIQHEGDPFYGVWCSMQARLDSQRNRIIGILRRKYGRANLDEILAAIDDGREDD